MARWTEIERLRGQKGRYYVGWHRAHPQIHMTTKEPMKKTSLVQISCDGFEHKVLAQTWAHSVFASPGTKGLSLFKQVTSYKKQADAEKAARQLKSQLATRYDKVTKGARVSL